MTPAEPYEPEIGQAIFGNPWGEFEVPNYGIALVNAVIDEIDRVFWNQNQREWDRVEDPKISGLDFRPYWWGDDDAPEAALPNLQLHGHKLEVRWYKHPHRGVTSNIELSPSEWAEWFDNAMQAAQSADVEAF